ncbi:hypothetical protein TWF718_003080 [Orbilia javanica]|uniref:PD-(D/E)XK nuclease-like domain-containing protein n=1 Tax=Orbilia javanica TaxID=47235 RepID=A0AAN8MJB8_9PEZI
MMVTTKRKRSLSTSNSTPVNFPLPPTVKAKRFKPLSDEGKATLSLEPTPEVIRWLSSILPPEKRAILRLDELASGLQSTITVDIPEFEKVKKAGKFPFQPKIPKGLYRSLLSEDIKKAEKHLADFEVHQSDDDNDSNPGIRGPSLGKDGASSGSDLDDESSEIDPSVLESEETQTSCGVAESRLQLRHSCPPILFSHHNQAIKGPFPPGVRELLKRTSPDNLAQGCLPSCLKDDLEEEYPDAVLPNWIFSEARSVEDNTKSLLLQVRRIVQMSTDLLILNADEQPWSELVNCILNGVVRKQLFEKPVRKLQVKRMYMHAGEESYFEAAYLDNVLDIEVDFMLEANVSHPQSPLKKLTEKPLSEQIPGDFNLSPLWDPLSQHCPAFAAIKATCQAGDWQEAQMHAGMGAVAILEKARSLGASKKLLPCVPAIVAIGHRWELNLVYEDDRCNYIVGGPWYIGGSNSFLEALKLVLVIEELWKYGGEEWWSIMVENVAVKAYEKYTTKAGKQTSKPDSK